MTGLRNSSFNLADRGAKRRSERQATRVSLREKKQLPGANNRYEPSS